MDTTWTKPTCDADTQAIIAQGSTADGNPEVWQVVARICPYGGGRYAVLHHDISALVPRLGASETARRLGLDPLFVARWYNAALRAEGRLPPS